MRIYNSLVKSLKMQCEIRGMADISEAGRPPPESMPKRGRVNEVCREWLVHEDGALAYKLQKEEVEQHYTGNKSRNAVVRLDTPLAKSEQQREQEEALAKHHQRVLEQEQYDAQVARQLAERMEREEQLRRHQREQQDEEVARQMQEREKIKLEKERREREQMEMMYQQRHPQAWQMSPPSRSPPQLPVHASPQSQPQPQPQPLPPRQPKPGPSTSPIHSLPPPLNNIRAYPKPGTGKAGGMVDQLHDQEPGQDVAGAVFGGHLAHTPPRAPRHTHGDVNAIGLPMSLAPEDVAQHIRQLNLSRHSPPFSQFCEELPSPEDLYEEEARRVQEEKDAEFARQLQELEEREGAEGLERDRQLAIEAQDQELAKMLQEKEKAKLKRARERAKQKALLKRQQDQQQLENCAGPSGSGASSPLSQQHSQITAEDEEGCYSLPHAGSPVPSTSNLGTAGNHGDLPPKILHPKGRRRFPDPEAIEELPSPSISSPSPVNSSLPKDPLRNIAAVIDPTYPRRSPSNVPEVRALPSAASSHQDYPEVQCDIPAPPYMPIQGQRRTASLEKKSKKKPSKDGCKQQ